MLIPKAIASDLTAIERGIQKLQIYKKGQEWFAFLEAVNIAYEEEEEILKNLLSELERGDYSLLSEILKRRNEAYEQKLRTKMDTD